jgi:death on curing protein
VKERKPVWIEDRDVLVIHDRLLAAHGGASGLRDEGLLQSALARPRQHYAYAGSPDIVEMASLYAVGIVRNHPFVDGNKRAGFVVGVLFLELNGFSFVASEEDATQAVFGLAAGTLDEGAFTAWLRANSRRVGGK